MRTDTTSNSWSTIAGHGITCIPGALAGLIRGFDLIGLEDPVFQAVAIRTLLGLAVFAGLALIAHGWLREGRAAAALCLAALAAFCPDLVFVGARTLSETAVIVPLVLAYCFWKRDPLVCGLLLGVMFAVRFQSAFFIAAFFAITASDDLGGRKRWFDSSAARMTIGLLTSLLAIGAIDRLTYGGWFHSPIECFRANVVEGVAATFGVEPWYRYLQWGGYAWLEAAPLALILLAVGVFREWRLALVALTFLAGHMLVGHKEPRFVWPLLPLLLILVSIGFETLYNWQDNRTVRRVGVTVLACSLVAAAWVRFERIDWVLEPSRASSLALAKVGRLPDVTGVAVCGLQVVDSGNYFFLRRDVPLLFQAHPYVNDIRSDPAWTEGHVNYLITRPQYAHNFSDVRLQQIDAVDDWTIYRVTHPASRTAHSTPGKASRHVIWGSDSLRPEHLRP